MLKTPNLVLYLVGVPEEALELVPSEFKDNYEEALAKLIARKSSGLPFMKNQLQSRLLPISVRALWIF
jgi:non-homologous end joining protein Ku